MIPDPLEEASMGQVMDQQLEKMAAQLTDNIQRAKTLAKSCKIGSYEEAEYRTNQAGELVFPQYKPHVNYNQEFWKKYLKNEINFALIKDLSEKLAELQTQAKSIEELTQEYQKLYKIKNRKKNRRLAAEIAKQFQCPYENCYRVYGSEVSLNLHIKLKHGGGNKTDREKLAQQIITAEMKGQPKPDMRFNLPKGFIERKKMQSADVSNKQIWPGMQ